MEERPRVWDLQSLGKAYTKWTILDSHFFKYYEGKKEASFPLTGLWKKQCESCLVMSDPVDYTVYGILQARILEWVAFPFSRGSSQPRDQTRLHCRRILLPAEPQRKPKNTGVGSLSLL